MRNPATITELISHRLRSKYLSIFGIKASLNIALTLCFTALALCTFAPAQTAGTFQVTNILSDGYVPALVTDPNFIDPWGISIGKDFWINANVTGLDYVALLNGTTAFKVTIPAATGGPASTGSPTGTVFTGSATGFTLPNGSKAIFLFCSLDGTISGWNGALGTAGSVAQITVNNSSAHAVYTDMALVTNPGGTFILATNFGQSAAVEVYDSTFKPAKLAGSFADPNIPSGYAPYAVHSIGSQVFVTYTLRTVPGGSTSTPNYQEILGPGNGFVSVFDTAGNFVSRAITGGNLNAPWGMAVAPATFGIFGGDLLVGNFGDGKINVYDPKTYAYLGQVTDGTGKSFAYPGLWELVFGTTGYGDVNALYFDAGLSNETHGLFGSITNTTTPTGTAAFGLSTSTQAASVTAGSSTQMTVSIAPTNSFSGSVTLACSGLPIGATCTFTPGQLTVSSTASATGTVTIQTSNSTTPIGIYGQLQQNHLTGMHAFEIASALLLPFSSLLAFTRQRPSTRQNPLRLLSLFTLLIVTTGFIAGCGSYSTPTKTATPTPVGTTQVTITATSGAVTQSTVVALTVN